MSDRQSSDSTPRLGTLLSLLAFVATILVASMQAWGGDAGSSPPDPLQGNFAHHIAEPTIRGGALMAPDAVPQGNALASEDEAHRGASALGASRVSFFMPRWFRKAPDRRLIAPPSVRALYHLRC